MRAIAISALSLFLAGCASQPHNIQADFVSASKHQGVECSVLTSDLNQATDVLEALITRQSKASTVDQVLVATGIGLAAGAMFGLLATDDHEDAISKLKGEEQALFRAAEAQCPQADLDYARHAFVQGQLWCGNRLAAVPCHPENFRDNFLENGKLAQRIEDGKTIVCSTPNIKRNEDGLYCVDGSPVDPESLPAMFAVQSRSEPEPTEP